MSGDAHPGYWPTRRHAILDWLITETVHEPFIDNLFGELCRRLREAGVPIDRATLNMRTLHPQFLGASLRWRPGLKDAEMQRFERSVIDTPTYLRSPIKMLDDGAEGIRERLAVPRGERSGPDFPIYRELREEGFTDYVALPVIMTNARRHSCTWATKEPSGFATEHLVLINDLLPVLAMVAEIRLNRRIAKNLLDTYIGHRAGARILAGEITRGLGETIRAAIWYSDMRDFTSISERRSRDEVIGVLNDYFDTITAPVARNNGEVLKFIGDAVLAVFPIEGEHACERALEAALSARRGMSERNEERTARGDEAIGYGMALHVGDVMWGNVGAADRLDFTVVGPAVNVAARLESLTKTLKQPLVISRSFVDALAVDTQEDGGQRLSTLGHHRLRGVEEDIEVFVPADPE